MRLLSGLGNVSGAPLFGPRVNRTELTPHPDALTINNTSSRSSDRPGKQSSARQLQEEAPPHTVTPYTRLKTTISLQVHKILARCDSNGDSTRLD